MKYSYLMLGIFWFILAHIGSFFQLNGQFLKTDWFRNNEFIVASAGILLSYCYIYGTKYTVLGTDELLWPARFIGFSVGMFIYAIMVNYFFSEGINTKTIVSLILCVILVSIQVFWK